MTIYQIRCTEIQSESNVIAYSSYSTHNIFRINNIENIINCVNISHGDRGGSFHTKVCIGCDGVCIRVGVNLCVIIIY